MKAWEIESGLLRAAIPVVLSEEEQGWDFCKHIEDMENILIRMRWHSAVPGSGAVEHLIVAAIQDTENMGYDVTEAEACIREGMRCCRKNDYEGMTRLYCRVMRLLNTAKKIEDHPYWAFTVYESFEQYAAAVRFPEPRYTEGRERYQERLYYGWMAQICAGAAGTAMEGYCTDNIRKVFGEVRGYVRPPNTYNDDITYEIAFLKALEAAGQALTSGDIAEQWAALVPFGWSAEDIALRNIKLGVYPPMSGYLNNPFREWIGAQMRGAVCGMVAPGNPREAARLAFMDGVVSHHNNGVLGEIFNAVMVSLAFTQTDIHGIVETASALIPQDSEYGSVIRYALACCKREKHWEDAWRSCMKQYERYNWIHAYPNACAEIIAMWFGEGSYDETIHICCMEGYDVDCNAAQIATVLGVIHAEHTLDNRWVAPIGDTLNTYMRGLPEISIRKLAEWTGEIACRLIPPAC
jgi:ADP-ribosylglycohydrolase